MPWSTLTSPGGPCSILAPLAAQSSGEIWALSVDDREVDSVVVDEGETDELASDVRIGLSAGGGSQVRTRLGGRVRLRPLRILRVYKKGGAATQRCPATFLL